jgi:hypothetical protein
LFKTSLHTRAIALSEFVPTKNAVISLAFAQKSTPERNASNPEQIGSLASFEFNL